MWRRIIARISRSFGPHPDSFTDQVTGLSRTSQAQSAELGTLRTDLGQTRATLENRLQQLELQRGEIAESQDHDRNRLTELERRFSEISDEHRLGQERISQLEATLAEAGGRLDTTAQQLATLDDRATTQLRTLDMSLGQALARMEEAENHASTMEQRLASRQDQLATGLRETRASQQRLRRRLAWSLSSAAGVLLLGAFVGVLLIRDMHANTRMLAGIRSDMNMLLASIEQRPVTQQALPEPPAAPVPPPPAAALPALPEPPEPSKPVVSESPATRPAPPWEAPPTVGRRDSNRYFLGRELDLFRKMSLADPLENGHADTARSTGEQADPAQIITTSSGLQYQILSAGSGRRPRLTDRVVLDYLGTTADGKTLTDTYAAGTPATLAMSELMPGWREALLLMREGAEWGLYVPPHLAQTGRIGKDDASNPVSGFYLIRLIEVI